MAFVEDFTVFFADFGVLATPSVGDPFTVIFDRAHIEAMGGDISGTQPVALAVSADVASLVSRSTTLTIAGQAGITFTVTDLQPDGTGLTLLLLEAS
jgi:hypothetical protein